MFPDTGTTQVFTPFGSGYAPLQHADLPTGIWGPQMSTMFCTLSGFRCSAKC